MILARATLVAFAIILTLIAIVQEHNVIAIKCYVCQSNVDPKCADPFDNLTLPITDCAAYPRADLVPKNELEASEDRGIFSAFLPSAPVKPLAATMCRKIRQKVNGEWRTIRGCGYLGPPGDLPPDKQDPTASNCQIRHGSYDVFMETCACNNKDGCNAAQSRLATGTISIPFVVAIVTLTAYFNTPSI